MDFDSVLLAKKLNGGGGSSVDVESLSVTENGTYTAPTGKAYSPVTVNVQPPQEAPIKDINFFDYDGRLLYSYTKAEWANVTQLPPLPQHDGLTAQNWTRTKDLIDGDVLYYHEPIVVGCYYNTVSGKTELDINLSQWKTPYVHLCPNGTVTIDWGDGSAEETLTGTSLTTGKSLSHTYANSGKYTIKIGLTSGSTCALGGNGGSTSAKPVISGSSGGNPFTMSRVYTTTLEHARIASGFSLSAYAFAICTSMTYYTCASDVTIGGNFAFNECQSLRLSTLGGSKTNTFKTCTSLFAICGRPNFAGSSFDGCNALKYINNTHASSSITDVGSGAFSGARSLTSITLPSSITTIGDNAFASTKSLNRVYIYAESVPTLSSNSFSGSTIEHIYVPYSADHSILNAYKGASNWSTYADIIEEMPQ